MRQFIPLSVPNFEGNEKKYVCDAVEQEWVSTGGSYIGKLEEQLADFLHVDQVAACQSGTAAIHLALIDAQVVPGDLVIVPTLTFIAAVNPVHYQFADPVFMDCDDSLCMDPIKLEKFCREECEKKGENLIHKATGRPVKALVVVHVFGNMADMERIMAIAREYNLKVIEDATEALGTCYTEGEYRGRYAGTIGDYGAFSFNGNKIITTGGGGAVTAKDPAVVQHLKYLSTQAKDDPLFYIHDEIGYNYRMTNLQAALGVGQMEMLQEYIRRKRENYLFYQELFSDNKYLTLLPFREGTQSNKWFYSLEIHSQKKIDMKNLMEELHKQGIQTRLIWGLIHEQKPYRNSITYDIEKAKEYADCVLNIPCDTKLTKDEMEYVAERIDFTVKGMIG